MQMNSSKKICKFSFNVEFYTNLHVLKIKRNEFLGEYLSVSTREHRTFKTMGTLRRQCIIETGRCLLFCECPLDA